MPNKKPVIFFIKPRILRSSVVYKVVEKQDALYFCRVETVMYAVKDSAKHINTRSSEEDLLKDRVNFKLLKSDILSVTIDETRSTWTAAAENNGVVAIKTPGRIFRFILHYDTPAEILREYFQGIGCGDVCVIPRAEGKADVLPVIGREEDLKSYRVSKHVLPVLNAMIVITAMWLYIYPVYFNIGAALMMLYPVAGVFLALKYRRFLKSGSRRSRGVSQLYYIPILIPPLLLSLAVLKNVSVVYRPSFFLGLLAVTAVCEFLLMFFRPQFRNKAWAVSIALLVFTYGYSGAIVTNGMYETTAAQYSAVVEGKHSRISPKTATYYLELSPWGKNADQNDLYVSLVTYRQASVGEPIVILEKRGLWGIEQYEFQFPDPA